MTRSIAARWKLLSGENDWKHLLDPLDIDLRQYLIHYGQMAQAAYDNFNAKFESKFAGDSIYSMKNMFYKVGLDKANPFKYQPTKYLYATSAIPVPLTFLFKSYSREAWSKESNWIGYVAVATDEGKAMLGRRDIVVAWRGSVEPFEWLEDFKFPLVSGSKLFGDRSEVGLHQGWLSVYTSDDPLSPFNTASARDQVLEELKRLMELYKNEEISITITGHSLGAALAVLCASDIIANGVNKYKYLPHKQVLVSVLVFACPRVGDSNFKEILKTMKDLHILCVRNVPDIVPTYPEGRYVEVGEQLVINSLKSEYLKPGDFARWHQLEVYLHGVAGTHGTNGDFHLEIKRDIALVNKLYDIARSEFFIPVAWWCLKNQGMVQREDGSWKLRDHENEDDK